MNVLQVCFPQKGFCSNRMNPYVWVHPFYISTISCRENCEKSQKYIDIVFGIDFELLFGYNIIQKHE